MKTELPSSLPMPIESIFEIEYKTKPVGYKNPLKSHKHSELIYVAYGQMEIAFENSSTLLSAGDFIAVPAGMLHGIGKKVNNRAYSYLNVMFTGAPPDSISGKIFSLTPKETDIIRNVKAEMDSPQENSDALILLFLNILLFMLKRREIEPIEIPLHMKNRIRYKNEVVNHILDYIDNHYAEPLNSEYIAAKQGMSSTHMRRLVKQVTGMTLSQYLISLRVNIARHLLLESSKNVNEIANKVGYNSFTHFCNVFKKETGMTPSQYAKSIGSK